MKPIYKKALVGLLEIVGTIIVVAIFLWLILIFAPEHVKAQVTDTYVPRPIAVFQPGQERACQLHWLGDLNALREWQSEYHYWRGRYNTYAEVLGFGTDFDIGHPTLNQYIVPKDLIQQEVDSGLYPDFVSACNSHVFAAHITEDQFSYIAYIMRLFTCHARASVFRIRCTKDFDKQFPLQFISRLK